MTFTEPQIREMAACIREDVAPPKPLTHKQGIALASAMLDAYADLLSQTCKTCSRSGGRGRDAQMCSLEWLAPSGLRYTSYKSVPITVNGQPFGCRGWQAKETK